MAPPTEPLAVTERRAATDARWVLSPTVDATAVPSELIAWLGTVSANAAPLANTVPTTTPMIKPRIPCFISCPFRGLQGLRRSRGPNLSTSRVFNFGEAFYVKSPNLSMAVNYFLGFVDR